MMFIFVHGSALFTSTALKYPQTMTVGGTYSTYGTPSSAIYNYTKYKSFQSRYEIDKSYMERQNLCLAL